MGRIKEFLILDVVLPLVDLKLHTHLPEWYHRIYRMMKWSPSEIEEWQNKQLRKLIDDAYRYSPYYHDLFDSLSLKPEEINSANDLNRIPPLTKEILRDYYDSILLQGKKGIHFRKSVTGGSTGDPRKYVKDNNSWGFINAFSILMWKQTGYHYGDRYLALGSSSIIPSKKKSILHSFFYAMKGKIPFNAMNMSPERIEECLKLIRDRHIHYIYGYASSVFLLAKYVEEHHLESTIKIRACFPTSEVLTDLYRKTMERVFCCPVVDMYGAHDGGIIAYSMKDRFKVGYNCIVETEDSEKASSAFLTDLTSNAFPFIRYQLGDELKLGNGFNDDFNGQVLDAVVGRSSDLIRLENGRVLTGPGFTVLFGKLPVKGYRIFKSGPLQITVEIVKEACFQESDERLILDTMQKYAGDECTIVIQFADRIRSLENGKSLFFFA